MTPLSFVYNTYWPTETNVCKAGKDGKGKTNHLWVGLKLNDSGIFEGAKQPNSQTAKQQQLKSRSSGPANHIQAIHPIR